MTTLEIIELIILGVVFLVIFTVYAIRAIKNKWIGQLMETIESGMRDAEEQFPHGHGDEKREIVLDALRAKCEELTIPFNILYTLFIKIISEIVSHWNILK